MKACREVKSHGSCSCDGLACLEMSPELALKAMAKAWGCQQPTQTSCCIQGALLWGGPAVSSGPVMVPWAFPKSKRGGV